MKRGVLILLALLLAAGLVLSACSTPTSQPPAPTTSKTTSKTTAPPQLPITTHPEWPKEAAMTIVRSVELDPWALPVAELFKKYVGITVTPVSVTTAEEAMNLLAGGKAMFARANNMHVLYANKSMQGAGLDPGGFKKARSMFVSLDFGATFWALKNSGIQTPADFKRKRVSYGAPGSSTEITERVIKEHGVTPGVDFEVLPKLGARDAIEALSEGETDVVYLGLNTVGVGNALIMEANAKKPVIPVSFDPERIRFVADKVWPERGIVVQTIPATQYNFLTKGVNVWGMYGGEVVSVDLDDELAYHLTKAIYDHLDELKGKPGTDLLVMAPEHVLGFPKPYHAGAVKYFKERGWWSQKDETEQKAALAAIGMEK